MKFFSSKGFKVLMTMALISGATTVQAKGLGKGTKIYGEKIERCPLTLSHDATAKLKAQGWTIDKVNKKKFQSKFVKNVREGKKPWREIFCHYDNGAIISKKFGKTGQVCRAIAGKREVKCSKPHDQKAWSFKKHKDALKTADNYCKTYFGGGLTKFKSKVNSKSGKLQYTASCKDID